jgi:O-acetyl-ADP-ribose deacetylase (regulator of RNase III)
MIKTISGNLIDLAESGNFDYIVHGCNCFHTMGSGLAGQLVKRYPLILEADKTSKYGDREKLGTWTSSKVFHNGHTFTIVNAYTQFFFGLAVDVFEYVAFDKFLVDFSKFLDSVRFSQKRIGFPMIGAGLAGGDWGQILKSIENFSESQDVTIVHFSK